MYICAIASAAPIPRDYLYAKLIDAILANGKGSGLIDLNLKLSQKLLDGHSEYNDNKDYTVEKL